ncbi:MAG TPA: thioredoxin-like domain-containing protein, partial [Puia sp.]|nr:thioredoxin-like domain-containing protein [Puia sp.]
TTTLNTNNIPTGKSLLVIGFSPWCKHCQAETQDIVKHIDSLKNTRILFVTPYPFDQMRTFYRYFKLSQYPNITMGRDTKDYFLTYFKAEGVPYTAIFDSKKRLIQAIANEAHASDLVHAAAE